ncbi:hypothetical protein LX16_0371 [Stackebrandtia albiflava]|uniref:Uncharacterized protein n=1 Tax=Stackebrandtia albiflava TaxID=406432 RepID=A0A562V9Y3_9ACTN|nr:hypothetical protein [Stackebrandtia albiflava]TWJ14684.1 hypothetical protein LX16_0371 [Stackebrandtia albiflava]
MSGDVLLVGANPIVRLFEAGRVTVLASVWRVDWSVRGNGTALVLWHDGAVRLLGDNPDLARWLCRDFTRHFPEAAGLPWNEPDVENTPVEVSVNLAEGVRAKAGDVTVEAHGPLGHRRFSTEDFRLAGRPHGLSLVSAPMAEAGVTVAGRAVPGAVRREGDRNRPVSSAFATEAETWWLP